MANILMGIDSSKSNFGNVCQGFIGISNEWAVLLALSSVRVRDVTIDNEGTGPTCTHKLGLCDNLGICVNLALCESVPQGQGVIQTVKQ